MKDYRKMALYAALVVIALTLFNKWQVENADVTPQATETTVASSSTHSSVPNVPSNAAIATNTDVPQTHHATTIKHGKLIWVQTDVLKVAIDTLGGNVVQSYLLKYPEKLHSSSPFQLFNDNTNNLYIAQSGLTGKNGPDTSKGQVVYQSAQSQYALHDGQNQLVVNLNYEKDGVRYVKSFTFSRGKYVTQVGYKISNNSSATWRGNFYTQLVRHGAEQHHSMTHVMAYTGAAISKPSDHYKKISFSDMKDSDYSASNTNGWAAMLQHYFLSAWVPEATQVFSYYSQVKGDNYTIGMIGPTLSAAPGRTVVTSAKLYVGPAVASRLDLVAPHLKQTIDYGWLWPISLLLFWVLKNVFDFLGNWGWSIVVVTIMIKACFYYLSGKSYRSMAHMRRLQPKMALLKERFADDKTAQSKAMMELYKKEKCNPIGGCLPMIVQIPFFIGFYYMISASVELRQAPFLLWIHDLAIPDPYYILPLIMGASMFLQQRLNPPAPDPMQQKIMMFLPVIFTFVFLNFPAGLVLYWVTNSAVSILQQWFINRQVDRQESKDHGHSKKRK